jgi:uncharacterized membrane protein YgcG
MNTISNKNNYFIMTLATITSIILLSTIMINPVLGYDLSDVKSSIGYEEAIDEFELPVNTKNFSMELDNGLVANYYLAPNQTFVFDGVSGAITEQKDNEDNDDGDGKKKIKYYVDVTVTTTYKYPSAQEKPQDPRNDPKYDSIDWQDDRGEEYDLSQEEMDEILEERENEEQSNDNNNEEGPNDDNSGNSDSGDEQNDGGGDSDSSGGDDGGGEDGGSDN